MSCLSNDEQEEVWSGHSCTPYQSKVHGTTWAWTLTGQYLLHRSQETVTFLPSQIISQSLDGQRLYQPKSLHVITALREVSASSYLCSIIIPFLLLTTMDTAAVVMQLIEI